uniref:DEAD-box RNA helicase Q domain-containing protein n=1 Tax=Monodelphis domestica TaxID=13616 RepID=A0A5F8HG25_MONDO
PKGSKNSRSLDDDPDRMDPDGVIKSNWNKIVDRFDEMNLSESLLHSIYAYGFEKTSIIQACSADPKGSDVIGGLHGCFLACLYWRHKCSG